MNLLCQMVFHLSIVDNKSETTLKLASINYTEHFLFFLLTSLITIVLEIDLDKVARNKCYLCVQ